MHTSIASMSQKSSIEKSEYNKNHKYLADCERLMSSHTKLPIGNKRYTVGNIFANAWIITYKPRHAVYIFGFVVSRAFLRGRGCLCFIHSIKRNI